MTKNACERLIEEIGHLQKIAGPDICRVIVQKGRPPRSLWLGCANRSDVLLDGTLAHMNAQFQEFSTNPFSAPEPIVRRHLPNQGDGFRGYLGLVRRGL